MKYEQLIDGVGSTVKNKEKFKLACCDCGLVHDVAIVAPKVRKGVELGFAVARNKRATAQRRRQIRLNVQAVPAAAGGSESTQEPSPPLGTSA